MEQDIVATEPAIDNPKPENKKGLKIAVITACTIIVCSAAGFGIFAIVQSSQKDSRKDDSSAKVDDGKDKDSDKPSEPDKLATKLDESKDWIYDADYSRGTTADSYKTPFETYYLKDIVVPYINVDSEYAKKSNKEIKAVFDDAIKTYNEGVKDQMTYVEMCEYDRYDNGDNISVVLTYGTGFSDVVRPDYYTYNIDLKTGNGLSYEEVYKIAGFSSDEIESVVTKAITNRMKTELSSFGPNDYPEGESFDTYNNMSINYYKKAVSNNTLGFYLSKDNQLMIVTPIEIPTSAGHELVTIIPVSK